MPPSTVCDGNAANFQQQVIARSEELPVLVDFWAGWCAPCRMLAPILEALVDSYQGRVALVKIDTDVEQALALQFNVRSLPTVKLFRHGQVVDEFMGVQPEHVIRHLLEPHVARASDELRAAAEEALSTGDADHAAALLEKALAEDPDNYRIHPLLADLLIERGDLARADALLSALPLSEQRQEAAAERLARVRLALQVHGGPDPAELQRRLAAEPQDSDARYRLAVLKIVNKDYAAGLEELLELVKQDRDYGDDAARKTILEVFNLLGAEHPLVSEYRGKLSSALF